MIKLSLIKFLAPVLARAILTRWLGGQIEPGEVAETLTDSLKDFLSHFVKDDDIRTRNQGVRLFEEIGESVAESLEVIFRHEKEPLSEGQIEIVAKATAKTLRDHATTKVLLNFEMDARLLANYLLTANPNAVHVQEQALYKRAIQECSKRIINVAEEIPHFERDAFVELVKQNRNILLNTEKILERFERIYENSQSPDLEATEFEANYRHLLSKHLDNMELFGLERLQYTSRRQPLTVAYVTLNIMQTMNNKRNTVPAPVALALSSRLLILGGPGTGKTTLLKWVAVRAAEQNFEEYGSELSQWQGLLPFFIRLRDYVAKGYELPTPDMLPIQLSGTRILADQLPKGWATKQLKLGRALILIDGLDEVNNEFRMMTVEWVKNLIALYPTAHYLISSRSSVITYKTLSALQSLDFDRAHVQPFSLESIEVLIDKWHEAVASQSALLTQKEQDELPILASELKKTLRKDLPVQRLATNPLLCAMICALHRDHNKKLPDDRIQLYQECIRMLLEGRDRQRDVDLQDYPHLEFRQKTTLLQHLAYWMTRNGLTTTSREETEERIKYKIKNMPRLAPEITSSKVLNYLVDRSGLLREPTEGNIDFAHRTFQEFFTAQEIVEQGDMRYLLVQIREKEWREIIILAAGLARPHDQEMLFAKLLEYGSPQDRSYYQLALSCLETVVQLSEKATHEIQRHLGRLAPPKDESEAQLFALAGKLALPYLRYTEQRPLSRLITCIDTLGLIGGDEALSILKGYIVESGRELACILGHVWNEFDRDLFFDQILQPSVDKWRYLCLYDVSHLEIVLQRLDFTRLQTLDLIHCNPTGVSDYLHLIPKHVFVREPLKSKENPKANE